MPTRPPNQQPQPVKRYRGQTPPPNMATPRNPDPGNKLGVGGYLILAAILAGMVWLGMLIFGWGPYQSAAPDPTATVPEPTALPQAGDVTSTAPLIPSRTALPAVSPTVTLTPTLAPQPYVMVGEPEYVSSSLIRPNLSCDWLVIAGQVWNLQDEPVTGYTLHLYGELGGYTIDAYKFTGSALAYGESGYEFLIEDLVITSRDKIYLQLADLDGNPISNPIPLRTFEDCQKNLILVNFKQVR